MSKNYLFFDTETTGFKNSRLVQLAYSNSKININHIIKPKDFLIPEDAYRIHNISTDKAINEGKEIVDVLEEFLEIYEQSDVIVAHNLKFDLDVINRELTLLGKDKLTEKNKFCTMSNKKVINYCKLPGKYGYKYPSLKELHTILFGTIFENAHNAKYDVQALTQCFFLLKEREIIDI